MWWMVEIGGRGNFFLLKMAMIITKGVKKSGPIQHFDHWMRMTIELHSPAEQLMMKTRKINEKLITAS